MLSARISACRGWIHGQWASSGWCRRWQSRHPPHTSGHTECSQKSATCQKARAWLDEHHITYNFRDIKLENPTYDELAAWHEHSGLPLKKFFNTSGLQYKALGLKDKLPGMSEEEMLQLLATDGMLVKRPLLVGGDFVLVGFKEAQWAERLGKL